MASVDELLALEPELDALALHSRIADLPRRSFLTGLLAQAHFVMHGGIGPGTDARPAVGRAMINRYSYLLDVLDGCPAEPIGASAANAISPFIDDPTLLTDQLYLVQYGHLCELLPEVRRGWYTVTGSLEGGFRLDHPTEDFSTTEARDTVLADLTLPVSIRPPANDAAFDAACTEPWFSGALLSEVHAYVRHFDAAVLEVPLFPDAGWQETFGIAEDDFLNFRAFWLAFAEVCFRMGEAVRRRIAATPDEALGDEYLEWVVPYLNSRFVAGLAMATTGISAEAYDFLMAHYSHTPGSVVGGDGFFPPFHPIGDGLLFAPVAVQMMITSRNVAYGLNRADPDRFAAVLSDHLEPFLLSKAAAVVGTLDGVEVRANVDWADGEIDLLAYDPATNVALHVQAKAPVPPQGARMTRAVEERALEGLRQLARFRDLAPQEVDGVVSAAFQRTVADVEVLDMLLVRTCLGTHRVWAELGEVAPANLHVLAAAVDRLNERQAGLGELPDEVLLVLDDLVADTTRGWVHEKVNYELASIEIPLLQLDEERLAAWQFHFKDLVH